MQIIKIIDRLSRINNFPLKIILKLEILLTLHELLPLTCKVNIPTLYEYKIYIKDSLTIYFVS